MPGFVGHSLDSEARAPLARRFADSGAGMGRGFAGRYRAARFGLPQVRRILAFTCFISSC